MTRIDEQGTGVDFIIYHNPQCATSRNTLALLRHAGVEPHVVEYLKTPPTRAMLVQLIRRMAIRPRQLLREKDTPYAELGLGQDRFDDDALIDAMVACPLLINRPIVVAPAGVRLCRPSERVLELLSQTMPGPFTKEDGEPVLDEAGKRIAGLDHV